MTSRTRRLAIAAIVAALALLAAGLLILTPGQFGFVPAPPQTRQDAR